MKDAIRSLRKAAKMTQSELAEKIGYRTGEAICMWESGARKPPSDKLPELAAALGCSISDLFEEPRADGRA